MSTIAYIYHMSEGTFSVANSNDNAISWISQIHFVVYSLMSLLLRWNNNLDSFITIRWWRCRVLKFDFWWISCVTTITDGYCDSIRGYKLGFFFVPRIWIVLIYCYLQNKKYLNCAITVGFDRVYQWLELYWEKFSIHFPIDDQHSSSTYCLLPSVWL